MSQGHHVTKTYFCWMENGGRRKTGRSHPGILGETAVAWIMEAEGVVVSSGQIQMCFESWKTGLGHDLSVLNQQNSEAPGDLGDTPPPSVKDYLRD